MAGLLIGDVAERARVPAPTIRYYESLGLLTPPERSSSGYRRYDPNAVEELRFIKKAQALGFSLDEIGEILNLARSGTAPCSRVLSLAQQHLAAVDERIRQLQQFRDHLACEIDKWDRQATASCPGLCELIVHADTAGDAVALPVNPPQRRRPAPRR
jgi:DNA-binding transcriptional MerR regulator